MKLSAKLAKESILNKNGLNHLQIEVIPPAMGKTENRKPSLVIFAIDKSGSMSDIIINSSHSCGAQKGTYSSNQYFNIGYGSLAGGSNYPHTHKKSEEYTTKLDYAINSTIKFMDVISDKDLIGVVSFDDVAVVDQPLTHITQDNKSSIISHVRQIYTRGCTNISDAIEKAKGMITADHLESYNCKIILLSDGQANRGNSSIDGLSSIALDCIRTGITITSLGIGLDYDSAIMGAIAESGGGLMHHIEDLSKLEEIFQKELELTSAVTAKGVKILIEIPNLIEIGQNLNGYPQKVQGNTIEILLGDMYNARKVLIEIRNNFVDSDIVFNICTKYKTLEENDADIKTSALLKVVKSNEELMAAKENKDVVDSVLALVKNNAIEQSSYAYQRGDTKGVSSAFNSTGHSLQEFAATYSAQNMSSGKTVSATLSQINHSYASNSISASCAKGMYAASNSAKRS